MRDLLLKLQRGKITLENFKKVFYHYQHKNQRPINRDIVMYSYRVNQHDHINEHEIKRLEHSIGSLREHNKDIEVYLFCDNPNMFPVHFKTKYQVKICPNTTYNQSMLNAWSIHRWYNLRRFSDINCNILYVDSDTIFNGDVKYLFETYTHHDLYGKEERGFRHCPIAGSSKDIRFNLDLVDACIKAEGGNIPIHKYCIGVILMNHNIHREIVKNLIQLSDIMDKLKRKQLLNPIPNPRILDQYAMWIIWSRMGATNALFGVQDVTHGWVEPKHKEYFNPIVLHYTTRDEQEFAHSDPKYANLIRDVDDLGIQIDPHSMV